jgi:hypothetical protein
MTMDDTSSAVFPESGLEKGPPPDWGPSIELLKGSPSNFLEEYLSVHPDGYGYSRLVSCQKVSHHLI